MADPILSLSKSGRYKVLDEDYLKTLYVVGACGVQASLLGKIPNKPHTRLK